MVLADLGSDVRQILDYHASRRFLLSYGVERIASWAVTVSLVVLVYRLTDSIGVVAAALLVQILARSIVTLIVPGDLALPLPIVSLAAIARVVAVAALILVRAPGDVWWALIAMAILAAANGMMDVDRVRKMPSLVPRRHIPALNRLFGRVEQSSALVGPVVAAATLMMTDERVVFGLSAVLLYLSGAVAHRSGVPADVSAHDPARRPMAARPSTLGGLPRDLQVIATGLIAIAALAILVRVILVGAVIETFGYSGWVYGLLLALVGCGALLGPAPVDRILGHFPAAFVAAGGVAWLAASALVIAGGGPLVLVAPMLVVMGLVVVTLDVTAAVVGRRSIPATHALRVDRSLARGVIAGQVVALICVLIFASVWSIVAASLVVTVLCVLATGLHFVRAGGVYALGRAADSMLRRTAGRRRLSN